MATRTKKIAKNQINIEWKKPIYRIIGVILFALSIFLSVSLLSYNGADPSFNKATDDVVNNIGGIFGAITADIFLQIFGFASIILVFTLISWSWRLIIGDVIIYIWVRFIGFCVGIITATLLLSYIEPPLVWPISSGFGGAMGALLQDNLSQIFSAPINIIIAIILSFISLPVAFGLKNSEWKWIYSIILSFIVRIFAYIAMLIDIISVAFKGDAGKSHIVTSLQTSQEKTVSEKFRNIKKRIADASEQVEKRQAKIHKKVSPVRRGKPKQKSLALRPKSGNYEMPSYNLLSNIRVGAINKSLADSSLQQNAKLLEKVLGDFGVKGNIINISPGPVVTLYELEPAAGTKSARVIGLADDISRSMSAISARISVIAGRNALGIELPNHTRETVYLREILEDDGFIKTKINLPLALGKNIGGEPIIADLARMPHLLVAGTTGSGKSVAINTMIISLLYHLPPSKCKFIMIDPKMLELSIYDNIPHLLSPVVTEPTKAVVALKWAVKEMENRYRAMASLNVRNIDGYNKRMKEANKNGEVIKREVQTGFDPETGKPVIEVQEIEAEELPYIVIIVDEMADLMLIAGKEIEGSIQRLAQMARAAGIHLIMATQRPSVDVITGVIKANFPTRISFQVTSRIDSRTILGEQGAEQLLGMGDMLYMAGGGKVTRIHGPFIGDKEVEDIVSYLKTQGEPNYVEDVTTIVEDESANNNDEDESDKDRELYDRAIAIVTRDGKVSTSYIQRCMKIGYNRAARLVDKMEREGLVSPANHVGKREILMRTDKD